jgi:Nucleotidyltransferase of unknown function (DUF6036)
MPSVLSHELPSPWRAFLAELDRQLPCPVELHCLGGFVAALYYALPRPTNDLDYVEVVPHDLMPALQEIAGVGSPLATTYRVHLQHVGVASLPECYATRLIEIVPGLLRRLRLFALDPHDLALSKLARNSPIDRDDVAQLARAVPLDADLLRARYRQELRSIIIGDAAWHDRTLEMWIAAYLGS